MKIGAATLEGCQQGTAPEMEKLNGTAAAEWISGGDVERRRKGRTKGKMLCLRQNLSAGRVRH